MENEFDKAVITLCDSLIRYYPNVYRSDDDSTVATARFWKKSLQGRVAAVDVHRFLSDYIGRSPFELQPPRPNHMIDFISKVDSRFYQQAVLLDMNLAAFYLSLYPKEPSIRLTRINEVSELFAENQVSAKETYIIIESVKKESEWRSYPPTMYDIINIVHRHRKGIAGCDQEFLNYCQVNETPAVLYIVSVIRRDNIRTLNIDRLSAIFKKIYFALEDKGWPELENYRETSQKSFSDSTNDTGSKEETHSIILN